MKVQFAKTMPLLGAALLISACPGLFPPLPSTPPAPAPTVALPAPAVVVPVTVTQTNNNSQPATTTPATTPPTKPVDSGFKPDPPVSPPPVDLVATVTAVSPNTLIAGATATITITGTNFKSGATVMIGNTLATGVSIVSATQITATVPAGIAVGAQTVVVTNPGAVPVSLSGGLQVQAPPPINDTFSVDSFTTNPTNNWAVGYANTKTGAFALDTVQSQGVGLNFWKAAGLDLPFVAQNPGGQINFSAASTYGGDAKAVIPAKANILHPGDNGLYSVVRWTAPRNGQFSVNATWSGMTGTNPVTTSSVLRLNSNVLWQSSINLSGNGNVASHTNTYPAVSGDSFYFMVGDGGNGYGSDSTLLSIQIQSL